MEILIGCLIPSIYSAITDALNRYLYDYITIPIFIAGLGYAIYTQSWENIFYTLIIFAVFYLMAVKGGIAGGDVKFVTALTIWFGYSILYILLLASITGAIFGAYKLYKQNILRNRIIGMFNSIRYGTELPKLPVNDEVVEEAVPFGTFLVISAWVVYLSQYI